MKVSAIYIAETAGGMPRAVTEVLAVEGRGLEGDRYADGRGTFSDWPEPGKEVTLIAEGALARLESEFGIALAPGAHRRNIVVGGDGLMDLVGRRFRIGDAELVGIRECKPCLYVEEKTVSGLRDALAACGGGLRAIVVRTGTMRTGDGIVETKSERAG